MSASCRSPQQGDLSPGIHEETEQVTGNLQGFQCSALKAFVGWRELCLTAVFLLQETLWFGRPVLD